MISTTFIAMEMEFKRGSELFFSLGKGGDSDPSLWQARSHNLIDTRVLPQAHQLVLCSQTLGSASGGVGTLGRHTQGQPHHAGVAVPTRHPSPGSCSRPCRGHLAARDFHVNVSGRSEADPQLIWTQRVEREGGQERTGEISGQFLQRLLPTYC